MSLPCHEIVIFRAAASASHQQVFEALASVDALLRAQPGFVTRAIRFDSASSYWIDQIEWDSRSSALRALELLQDTPLAAALGSVIDPASMLMLHGEDASVGAT